MDNKMQFKNFLNDTSKLSSTSIAKYVSTVERISIDTMQYINKNINLYDITEFIEAAKIIEEINLSNKFISKNIKGQKMYSSGLNWYLKYLKVNKIIDFISWNDSNGVYKIKDRVLHEFPCLTYEESIRYFFGILNEDFYYKMVDNIFELSYQEVVQVAKENNIYENMMEKLKILLENKDNSEQIYRDLIQ